MRLFDRLGETGDIVITVREAYGYDARSSFTIAVEDWLSDQDEPSPTRDLGLRLQAPKIPAVIGGLNDDGRAVAAGLQVGDEVIAVGGSVVKDWSHLVEMIQSSPEQLLRMTVLREGIEETVVITPASVERGGNYVGFIGASVEGVSYPEEMQRTTSYPIYSAWIPALEKTWDVTAFTLVSIKKMIVGAISTRNLSGPITIAKVANATAESGLESFIGFIALLSISLGVINLLPIPVLDGGHLLYYFIEVIAGRPVPERMQMWGLQVGMFFIVSIMMLAIYNDLTRL